MIKGKQYVRKDGKPMLFGIHVGIFTGYSGANWPMFDLGENKMCMINAPDEYFIEHEKGAGK
jgi:hypothetical protein